MSLLIKPRKYIKVLVPRKLFNVIRQRELKLESINVAVIQIKYDGSNILKIGKQLYTRHLNPVPREWRRIITSRFPEILRSKHNFYFEFGGKYNAPAGYREMWETDWDYRVIEMYDYRYPLNVEQGLRIVETLYELWDIGSFEDVIDILRKAVNELERLGSTYEGVVVKFYTNKKLFAGKVKWENIEEWRYILDNTEVVEDNIFFIKEHSAPAREIRQHIHKILVEEYLSKGLDIEKVGVGDIWNELVEELRSHGYELSRSDGKRVYEILKQVKKELLNY